MSSPWLSSQGRLRPFWRFCISVVVTFAILFAAGTLLRFLGATQDRVAQVPLRLLVLGALLAAYSWLLATFDKVKEGRLAAMGLPSSGQAARHALIGTALGGGAALLTSAIIAWRGELHVQGTLHLAHDLPIFVLVFAVLAAAAMSEELIFRGYPFQRLAESIGPAGAIAVLSLLFGSVHLQNPNASKVGVVNTVLVGVVLAIAYLRTRMLWLPFGIHWGWNAMLGVVVGLPVSGLDMSLGLHSQATGPAWLTGGAYGPEASVPCTVTIGLLLVVVLACFRRPAVEPSSPVQT